MCFEQQDIHHIYVYHRDVARSFHNVLCTSSTLHTRPQYDSHETELSVGQPNHTSEVVKRHACICMHDVNEKGRVLKYAYADMD